MARLRATIETRSVGETRDVEVEEITSMGIIVASGEPDETLDVLIPWHRVWEVYSHHKGVLLFETRGS